MSKLKEILHDFITRLDEEDIQVNVHVTVQPEVYNELVSIAKVPFPPDYGFCSLYGGRVTVSTGYMGCDRSKSNIKTWYEELAKAEASMKIYWDAWEKEYYK